MELFKSLENKTKSFNDPFKHFEINEPLTRMLLKKLVKQMSRSKKRKFKL